MYISTRERFAKTVQICMYTYIHIHIYICPPERGLLKTYKYIHTYTYIHTHIYIHIQGVPGGKDLTSGECSLGQTIPI